jgi:hypothetical protein
MIEDGPWFALAEGTTFKDMIFAALSARGRIGCPQCRTAVEIDQGSSDRCEDVLTCV